MIDASMLKEWRKLAEAATPDPLACHAGGGTIGYGPAGEDIHALTMTEADCDIFLIARNAVLALVDEVERIQRRSVEFDWRCDSGGHLWSCDSCGQENHGEIQNTIERMRDLLLDCIGPISCGTPNHDGWGGDGPHPNRALLHRIDAALKETS